MKRKYLYSLGVIILVVACIVGLNELQPESRLESENPISENRKKQHRSSQNFKEVFSVGLGKLPKIQRVEETETYSLYGRYGLQNVFSPGLAPHEETYFTISFNDRDEIAQIAFNQGAYKSISRANQIMKRMESLFGIEILQIGVEGLTLQDEARMKDLLKKAPFSGYYEKREFELTPITFKKTSKVKLDPKFADDLMDKQLNGFLIRESNGPRSELINSDLPDYFPNEKIRWFWSLEVFPSEFEKMFPTANYPLSYVDQFDEPTPEAFAKRKLIRTKWIEDGAEFEIVKDQRDEGIVGEKK